MPLSFNIAGELGRGAPGGQAGGVDLPHAARARQPDPDPLCHGGGLPVLGSCDAVPSSSASSSSSAAALAAAPPADSSSWLSASSSLPPAIRPVSSSRVTWLFSSISRP